MITVVQIREPGASAAAEPLTRIETTRVDETKHFLIRFEFQQLLVGEF